MKQYSSLLWILALVCFFVNIPVALCVNDNNPDFSNTCKTCDACKDKGDQEGGTGEGQAPSSGYSNLEGDTSSTSYESTEEDKSSTGDTTSGGCINFWMNLGGATAPGFLSGGRLEVVKEEASPTLSTPQSLRYTFATALTYKSSSLNASGAPEEVKLMSRSGEEMTFAFSDGSSQGVPQDEHRHMDFRLVMVDTNGVAVTNNPVYYDLAFPGGNSDRFDASTNNFGELHSVYLKGGRRINLADSGIEIIRDEDDILRQIKAPQCTVDIITNSQYKYTVDFYAPENVGSKNGEGLYTFTDNPFACWEVENPDPDTLKYLNVSRITATGTNVMKYVYTPYFSRWDLDKGDGLNQEIEYSFWDDSGENHFIVYETKDFDGNIMSKNMEISHLYAWGEAVVSQISDPDGEALITTNTHYITSSETGRYSRIHTTKSSDGSWISYDYDNLGRKTVKIHSYKDAAFNSSSNDAKAVFYDYTSLDGADIVGPNDQRPRTIREQILGVTVGKIYCCYATNASGQKVDIVEKCSNVTNSYGDADNLRTTITYYHQTNSVVNAGLVESIVILDGTKDTYTYEFGYYYPSNSAENACFIADADGDAYRITVQHGTTNSNYGVANKSTADVKVFNNIGNLVLSETYVYTGGTDYERISWAVTEHDVLGHVVKIYYSNGTERDIAWASCGCGKESEISTEGIEYVYSYDLLNRLVSSTKKGTNSPSGDVVTYYTYDAADRRLTTVITNAASGLGLRTAYNAYNTAGQLVSSTDQRDLTTTYDVSNGGRTTTVISPGPLTNITENYLDGRTKYVMVNGDYEQYYDYGPNGDGTRWEKVYYGPNGTNSLRWAKTTRDLAGRRIREEKPGFGGTTLTNEYFYNSLGQLEKETTPGMSATLYEYDELGQLIRSGFDINDNDSLDLSSNDRIGETSSCYEQDGSSDWWLVSSNGVYAIANSNELTTAGYKKTRLTGLSSNKISEIVMQDIHGNQVTGTVALSRGEKRLTTTVDSPDSDNDAINITINGQLMSSETKSGLIYTWGYDGLGRRVTAIDPRTGVTTASYNSKGQIFYFEDAASNRTSYVYDSYTGLQITITNASGKVARFEYDAEGRKIKEWGDNIYPVEYGYDDFERMISMSTYRDGTNWTSTTWPEGESADTTQWQYDEATGLLTNKLYADSNGTAYSYTSDGKLETRTLARGITTTYIYTNTTGEMIGIDYSDSTPDIAFTFNRIGRQTQIIDAQGTRTFAYNSNLQLESESIIWNGTTNVITKDYATNGVIGRNIGFDLDSDYSIAYDYSDVGRFSSLSSVVSGLSSNTWTYSYLADSDLISQVVDSNASMTNNRSYEAHRNLVTAWENIVDGVQVSKYEYSNDVIGRKTERVDTVNSVVTTNEFSYNDRSELTGAVMDTNSYDYVFDNIGNRQSYTNNGEAWTYLANELNQYTNVADGVTNSPAYDADGNMLAYGDWTFTWNGENRLATADNGSTTLTFDYDYMGRRFKKEVAGASTNYFIYDGWNLIQDVTCSSGTSVTNLYVWGLDLSETFQGAGGIGGLLSWSRSSDSNTFLYCYDAIGNVGQLIDESDGSVDAVYEYDPFGNVVSSSGTEENNNIFRLSTKYADVEMGLYYYGYRYYNPITGRWLNRDFLGETGGKNLYGFVNNATPNSVDVLGLTKLCCETALKYIEENPETAPEMKKMKDDGCYQGMFCEPQDKMFFRQNAVDKVYMGGLYTDVSNLGEEYKQKLTNNGFKESDFLVLIAIDESKKTPFSYLPVILHELSHARSLCGEHVADCEECIKEEVKAQYCSGMHSHGNVYVPATLNFGRVVEGSCGRECKDDLEDKKDALIKIFNDEKEKWISGKYDKQSCNFYGKDIYGHPPVAVKEKRSFVPEGGRLVTGEVIVDYKLSFPK